jgi:hypothetical protein
MSEQREPTQRSKLSTAPRDSDTVTVACKLPNGLILQLHAKHSEMVPIFGGGYKEETIWRRTEEIFVLNGCAVAVDQLLQGNMPDHYTYSGYALTPGVPKKFWEEWLEQNKTTDLIRNKIVFAAGSEREVRAEASEYKDVRSGLEPIDPTNPSAKSAELRRGNKPLVQPMTRD